MEEGQSRNIPMKTTHIFIGLHSFKSIMFHHEGEYYIVFTCQKKPILDTYGFPINQNQEIGLVGPYKDQPNQNSAQKKHINLQTPTIPKFITKNFYIAINGKTLTFDDSFEIIIRTPDIDSQLARNFSCILRIELHKIQKENEDEKIGVEKEPANNSAQSFKKKPTKKAQSKPKPVAVAEMVLNINNNTDFSNYSNFQTANFYQRQYYSELLMYIQWFRSMPITRRLAKNNLKQTSYINQEISVSDANLDYARKILNSYAALKDIDIHSTSEDMSRNPSIVRFLIDHLIEKQINEYDRVRQNYERCLQELPQTQRRALKTPKLQSLSHLRVNCYITFQEVCKRFFTCSNGGDWTKRTEDPGIQRLVEEIYKQGIKITKYIFYVLRETLRLLKQMSPNYSRVYFIKHRQSLVENLGKLMADLQFLKRKKKNQNSVSSSKMGYSVGSSKNLFQESLSPLGAALADAYPKIISRFSLNSLRFHNELIYKHKITQKSLFNTYRVYQQAHSKFPMLIFHDYQFFQECSQRRKQHKRNCLENSRSQSNSRSPRDSPEPKSERSNSSNEDPQLLRTRLTGLNTTNFLSRKKIGSQTLFVLFHGFGGNPYDMEKVRAHLQQLDQNFNFLSIRLTDMNMGLEELSVSACNQLRQQLNKKSYIKYINAVAFSLGGLVARATFKHILQKKIIEGIQQKLNAFISMASPHLGFFIQSCFIKTGLRFMQALGKLKCVADLMLCPRHTQSQIQGASSQPFVQQMSRQELGLKSFETVVVMGTYQDRRSPICSSVISCDMFGQTKNEEYQLEKEMEKNFHLNVPNLIKINVWFDCKEDFFDFTKKQQHIGFLENDWFLNYFVNKFQHIF